MNLGNVRLEYEYTINDLKLENGKYLFLLERNGSLEIYKIHHMSNEGRMTFYLEPITSNASNVGVGRLGDIANIINNKYLAFVEDTLDTDRLHLDADEIARIQDNIVPTADNQSNSIIESRTLPVIRIGDRLEIRFYDGSCVQFKVVEGTIVGESTSCIKTLRLLPRQSTYRMPFTQLYEILLSFELYQPSSILELMNQEFINYLDRTIGTYIGNYELKVHSSIVTEVTSNSDYDNHSVGASVHEPDELIEYSPTYSFDLIRRRYPDITQ